MANKFRETKQDDSDGDQSKSALPPRTRQKLPVGISLFIIGLVVVLPVGFLLAGPGLRKLENKEVVCKFTDDSALLTACRKLIRENGPGLKHTEYSGSDPRLPSVIRNLHGHHVHVDSMSVFVDFGGGFVDSFGVKALTPGVPNMYMAGAHQLLPGLWYQNGNDQSSPQ